MAESLHVEARWEPPYASVATARGHEVRIDEPVHVGGEDSAMMPTELFFASVATCYCLAVAHVARKREIELPELRATVDAERVGNELRYSRLRIEIAAVADEAGLQALVERAKPFCWVSNMLADDVAVTYVVTALSEERADAR